jgi:hypothetical protein
MDEASIFEGIWSVITYAVAIQGLSMDKEISGWGHSRGMCVFLLSELILAGKGKGALGLESWFKLLNCDTVPTDVPIAAIDPVLDIVKDVGRALFMMSSWSRAKEMSTPSELFVLLWLFVSILSSNPFVVNTIRLLSSIRLPFEGIQLEYWYLNLIIIIF